MITLNEYKIRLKILLLIHPVIYHGIDFKNLIYIKHNNVS